MPDNTPYGFLKWPDPGPDGEMGQLTTQAWIESPAGRGAQGSDRGQAADYRGFLHRQTIVGRVADVRATA